MYFYKGGLNWLIDKFYTLTEVLIIVCNKEKLDPEMMIYEYIYAKIHAHHQMYLCLT